MSRRPIALSPDLRRLVDEGYDIDVVAGHLVIRSIPYLTAAGVVERGILVSELTLAGDRTAAPGSHVMMFSGEFPCNVEGHPLPIAAGGGRQITPELVTRHTFSSKPTGGGSYSDYYAKVAAYVALLSSPARAVDVSATAKTFPVRAPEEEDSIFEYVDTFSSRAGIGPVAAKLRLPRVAIVGLGGTGTYTLDLVAKTEVREIHLFDGDVFLSHNAFRSPGAASLTDLQAAPKKVDHFKSRYSRMRKGLIAHPYDVDATNVEELRGMDFVFLCMEGGTTKKVLVDALEEFGVPFIDVGLGVELVDDALRGSIRVTVSTADARDHFRERVSFGGADSEDLYETNIQVSELNALNATLAVIRWKKLFGFYLDFTHEHNTTYVINSNILVNDDEAEPL